MAEIVLTSFLTAVFEKLASASLNKLVRSNGIQSELKKWERSLIQIQSLLNDASHKEITDEAVKRWLNSLQHLAYDIDDILDDIATETMHHELTEEPEAQYSKLRKLILTCFTSFPLRTNYVMKDKLDNITTKLQDLVDEKNNLGLIVKDERSKNMNRRIQTSLVNRSSIFGRQSDKEALLYKLFEDESCNQNFSIVPVVGMGGVGKTTLARLLYDEKQVKDHFELKAWVCVSDVFDIFNISKVIFESVTGENRDFADLNLLQVALRQQVTEKRFLIVLDDVWSESFEEWETLVGPFLAGARGSKIIMTTRKQQLLKQLGYNQPYHLQSLSHHDALSLFAHHALGVNNFDLHPTLRPHGEGIVKKCDGLPLALRSLGRLLRTKTDEDEWKELLNSEIWKLEKGDKIIPALRLSYYDLSASLKQLFAYCSLFPKDYVFDKDDLILLWMAEGFLHQSTASKSTERLGHEYFEELVSRSFFQPVPNEESLFIMHDLMNDLATSIAGDFFVRLDNGMVKDVKNEGLEKVRHMSFVREKYIIYEKFKAFKGARGLRTFLAVGVADYWKSFYLSNKILDLLPELPLLRVLSLSDYKIFEVPESIGSLSHLRYLNLCRTRITHLPESVGNLYNLQTLIVFGCHKLKKLPNSFLKLKKLRHFDVGDTPLLNEMPLGIGELISLQTLSKIIIEGDNGFSITELKNLKDLCGKISITGLEKVQNARDAREANFAQKKLTELELKWNDVVDDSRKETLEKEVLNELKSRNDYLEKLGIVKYGGTEFPNWVVDPLLTRLTHVLILGCKRCTSLPPLGQLLSLKKLFFQDMDGVQAIGLELFESSRTFPSLEILSFKNLSRWEKWSTDSGATVVFPCLQELYIEECPNLVEVSLGALPLLRILKLDRCSNGVLKTLVHAASSLSKLEIESVLGLTDEVWGGVIQYLGAVEELSISNCNEIRYVWKSQEEASKVLLNLRMLNISFCENLASLGEKEEDGNCRINLTSLRALRLSVCNRLERFVCPNNIELLNIFGCTSIDSISFPTGGRRLKSLYLGSSCDKLLETESGVLLKTSMSMLVEVNISWRNLKSIIDLSYFVHLTILIIEDCPNLVSFPDHELPNLTLLKHLVVKDCPSMDASFPNGRWPPNMSVLSIGRLTKPMLEWGYQGFPASLVNLELCGGPSEDARNFSQLSPLLPSSLTKLEIHKFEKLKSISVGLQHLTTLRHLEIWNCPKMLHLPETILRSLLSLYIYECPQLVKKFRRRGSYWPLMSHIPCIKIHTGDL